ncbi:hypothetical protein GGC47_001051 [Bosea sp. OAE752]|uniref:hypothetical protein n=1 Tax=Bosea sp. OAE752 TaxID=2663873 RepID=UPI003D25CFA5
MTRSTITPAEAAELQKLYQEHAARTQRAHLALAAKGMESAEFIEEDMAAGIAWRQIREILGKSGQHWMA